MYLRFNDMDRLFGTMQLLQKKLDNFYGAQSRLPGYGREYGEIPPRTNLYEDNDMVEIQAAVPGIHKEDIRVKIQGNYLEISGTRRSDAPKGYRPHRTERGSGSFSRSFTLPADVDASRVEATLRDGVLYLTLPKSEAARARKIRVS